MVTVDYVIQHNVDDEYVSNGDLAGFVLNFRKLFVGNLIPPLSVMNNIFLKAEVEVLNSDVIWEPFSISEGDYQELVDTLISNPRQSYQLEKALVSIDCYFDWYIWAMEKAYGVPSEKHRQLELHTRDCEKRKREAIDSNMESNVINALHSECVIAVMELADYLDKYIGSI